MQASTFREGIDIRSFYVLIADMRLILRSLRHQAKIEGGESITDRDDDYAVVVDGPKIGRIYRETGGPSKGKWYWFLQVPPYGKGIADTLDKAKDELVKLASREGKAVP